MLVLFPADLVQPVDQGFGHLPSSGLPFSLARRLAAVHQPPDQIQARPVETPCVSADQFSEEHGGFAGSAAVVGNWPSGRKPKQQSKPAANPEMVRGRGVS